jgi:hypothetical protein
MMRPVLVIAGSGRSGTTWVLDVIAQANHLRTIFEPLHPVAIPEAQRYAYRYIPENLEVPDLKEFLGRVFKGSLHSAWSDYRIRPHLLIPRKDTFRSFGNMYKLYRHWTRYSQQYWLYRKNLKNPHLIVKMIRANLMLGWLHRVFDARIVLVVRHPGAVVESKLRLGGSSWQSATLLDFYRKDQTLRLDYGDRYTGLLEQKLSLLEAHTLSWCIENQIPLEQARRNGYLVVFYEKLLTAGQEEWDRIVCGLGLHESPHTQFIKQPSQQASRYWHTNSANGTFATGWMERLGIQHLGEIDAVLRELGVSVYNAYDPMPYVVNDRKQST